MYSNSKLLTKSGVRQIHRVEPRYFIFVPRIELCILIGEAVVLLRTFSGRFFSSMEPEKWTNHVRCEKLILQTFKEQGILSR